MIFIQLFFGISCFHKMPVLNNRPRFKSPKRRNGPQIQMRFRRGRFEGFRAPGNGDYLPDLVPKIAGGGLRVEHESRVAHRFDKGGDLTGQLPRPLTTQQGSRELLGIILFERLRDPPDRHPEQSGNVLSNHPENRPEGERAEMGEA